MTSAVSTSAFFGTLVGEFPTIRLKHAAKEVRDHDRYANFPDTPYYGLEHIRSYTGDFLNNEGETPTGLVARFRPGNVLFGKLRPYLAKVALPTFLGTTSTEVIVLNPHSNYDARFLRYVLLSKSFLDAVNVSTYGTRMPRTSWGIIGNMRIPNPPLDIQRRIADFLDRETAQIDELVEKKGRLHRVLHEKVEASIIHRIIHIPDANVQPIHRVGRVVTGRTPSRSREENFSATNGIPWATPSNLGFFAPIEDAKEKLTSKGIVGQVVVPPGTTLVNGIGAGIGKVGITGTEMSFNQQIHAVLPYRERLNGRFLFYVMWSKMLELATLASNTTLPIINAERFSRIEIPVPDMEVQLQVATQLDHVVKRIGRLQERTGQAISRLRQLRSSLITAALSGSVGEGI